MLEGAKQEGTSDVAYSRNPTSALEADQEPQRHSIARESGTAKITQTCDSRLSKGGCIRLPCLIVSSRRRSRRPESGAGSKMHAHEMNVDPDLDGIRGDSRLPILFATGVPTQRTLT